MIEEPETMETTPEEVAAIVMDTDLYLMLPEKGYVLADLFREISAAINCHYAPAMHVIYNRNDRLKWLIERIHSELIYSCPKGKIVDRATILASAGF